MIANIGYIKKAITSFAIIPIVCGAVFLLSGCDTFSDTDLKDGREEARNYKNTVYLDPSAIVGIKSDGTVAVSGFSQEVLDETALWTDIVQVVSPDNDDIVGLRANGTVVASGKNASNLYGVGWAGIAELAQNNGALYGRKEDGTVVAVGVDDKWGRLDVSGWKNVKKLYNCDSALMYGVTEDGHVVASEQELIRSGAGTWVDIVGLSCSSGYLLGLKSDGTVLNAYYSQESSSEIAAWTNIVDIAAGDSENFAVGLRSDGTVVFTANKKAPGSVGGPRYFEESIKEIGSWKGVVDIEASSTYALGLTYDGSVLFAGRLGAYRNSGFDFSSYKDCVSVFAGRQSAVILNKDGILSGYVNTPISGFPPLW